jgi:hypothetical protein
LNDDFFRVTLAIREGWNLWMEKHVVAANPAEHHFFQAWLGYGAINAIEQVYLVVHKALFEQLVGFLA